MKCEICHKNDAQTALKPEKKGEDELYVCNECAQKETAKRETKRQKRAARRNEPPKELKALVNAVTDLFDGLGKAISQGVEKEDEPRPEMHEIPLDGVDKSLITFGCLHLEGLYIIGEHDAIMRSMAVLDMDIKGIYLQGVGEAGHTYRICYPEGMDEATAQKVFDGLVTQEKNARIRLVTELPLFFGDSVMRSLAILRSCKLLSPAEYFDLLSPLKLAELEGLIQMPGKKRIASMMDDFNFRDEEMGVAEENDLDARLASEANRLFAKVKLTRKGEQLFMQ